MGTFVISLLAAIGSGGWVYGKMQQRTGGLTKKSLTTAGVCALAVLVILWVLLELFIK